MYAVLNFQTAELVPYEGVYTDYYYFTSKEECESYRRWLEDNDPNEGDYIVIETEA